MVGGGSEYKTLQNVLKRNYGGGGGRGGGVLSQAKGWWWGGGGAVTKSVGLVLTREVEVLAILEGQRGGKKCYPVLRMGRGTKGSCP